MILCAHGTRSASGQVAVRSLIDAVRDERPELEIHEAYLDVQEPDVVDVAEALTGRGAVTVPLLFSAGYHVHVDLTRAAARTGATLTPTLGPDPRLTQILLDRLPEASQYDAVVLAAAGSSDLRSARSLEAAAAHLARARGGPVRAAHLSGGQPRLDDVLVDLAGSRVAVLSYLLAPGFFARKVAECGAAIVTAPLLSEDAPPPSALVDLVLDRIHHAAAAGLSA
ncbi:MAG: CbiX/SirB N-terminal domain-containing protein [Mobilicoccus sp.]|nr:CbiX/SirB N-terminal domain-containing protein [Mobilicoccus sp.]